MQATHLDFEYILKSYEKKNIKPADDLFNVEIARTARNFHRQIPTFRQTPLYPLPHLADMLGVEGIFVKDESQRLELNSFKVMGGSFAIYRFLQKKLGLSDEEMSYKYLFSKECHEKLG